jgi:hypothetical protein
MNTQVTEAIRIIYNTEKYTDENKSGWRQLFQLAKTEANRRRQRSKIAKNTYVRDADEIVVQTIVDEWLAHSNEGFQSHSNPSDNQLADDMSCTQALEKQAREHAIELIKEVFTSGDHHLRERTRTWLSREAIGVNPRLSSYLKMAADEWLAENASEIIPKLIKYSQCDITSYSAHATTNERSHLRFDEYEDLDSADQQAIQDEYRETFYQEPDCDPDDQRFIGTPPKNDSWDAKFRSNYVDRKRGSGGTLGGLYQNTLPEPSYYSKERRNRIRMSYLDSDSECFIRTGAHMFNMSKARREALIARRIAQLPTV